MRPVLLSFIAALALGCSDDEAGVGTDASVRFDAASTPADAGQPDADPLRPETLEDTGLYQDFAAEVLADGVVEFEPQFPLWTDGATKRRWALIPDGTTIDTSDMDFWVYPVGTKLWKEFSRDGKRIETRLLYKTSADRWYMMAYIWNDAQDEALAAPDGADDVASTAHDVPSQNDCQKCHSRMPDISLGFTAIQLDHSGNGQTMADLVAGNLLSDPPSPPGGSAPYFAVPGDATAQAALGYMHGNCGGCHHAQSDVLDVVPLQLRLEVGKLNNVTQTPTYSTAFDVDSELTKVSPGVVKLIDPGFKETSVIYERMNRRDMKGMPPLGSEDVDTAGGLMAVGAWIDAL